MSYHLDPTHPLAALRQIQAGVVPAPQVLEHLARCADCEQFVAQELSVDLDRVFGGVLAELHAPRATLLERVLDRLRLPVWLARSVTATPALRGSWLACSVVVISLAALVGALHGRGDVGASVPPLLLLAPCVVAAAVAFCYGPRVDPLFELTQVTPASRTVALLARMGAVMAVNSVVIAVASGLSGGPGAALAWFPSMAAVSLLSAVVAARTRPVVGVGAGLVIWVSTVLAVSSAGLRATSALWGAPAQLCYGVAALGLGVLLVHWIRHERVFLLPQAGL
ncbi:MAG: hypothetical protein ACLQCU_11310 [Acidimicrobiales bacterium]